MGHASYKRLTRDGPDICLAGAQGDQCVIAVVGDGDNSLSMRRVKSGSRGCMNHAAGGGGGWHCAAVGGVAGVEKD
jgi:hypothetical protein